MIKGRRRKHARVRTAYGQASTMPLHWLSRRARARRALGLCFLILPHTVWVACFLTSGLTLTLTLTLTITLTLTLTLTLTPTLTLTLTLTQLTLLLYSLVSSPRPHCVGEEETQAQRARARRDNCIGSDNWCTHWL